MEDVFSKSYLFVTLLSDSLQFQKQLVTKSETHFGFKPLRNHWYINRKINSNKYKSQKAKRVVSPSLSYLHGLTEKSLASGYYCYLRCVLYLVKDVKKLLGAYEVFRFQVSKVSCRWIFRFVLITLCNIWWQKNSQGLFKYFLSTSFALYNCMIDSIFSLLM